ncbi:ComEC family competence protein [Thalassospira sp. MA62]|nr:ComEC family competence protein [Thalassospira sp. MA62]
MLAFALQLAVGFFAGLAVSAIHTATGPSDILTRTLYSTEVTGTVRALEERGARLRVIIHPSAIDGLSDRSFDWNVRISFLREKDIEIGDVIRARARLFPLSPPATPGDPDFARNLYFGGIGATGFVFGHQYEILEKSVGAPGFGWMRDQVEHVRQAIASQIDTALDQTVSGIAKALIIGDRGDVSAKSAEDLRKSGLAHLLAISGLHMGLLSGTVYFLIRLGLACVPSIALRYPIKKWAAIGAMLAGAIYLGLSGATVPTQRAFIMLMVVWLAVLLDRRAISMRLVGVAAVTVLLIRPDAVLGASFQLSFAAVAALVAFYDGPGRRWLDRKGPRPWSERLIGYVIGLMITGMIVTAITAPIIGFHFGRISILGIFANLIAIPVMAFWVMPTIILFLALSAVGLGDIALWAMEPGLSILLGTASLMADQDWGITYVSAISPVGVGLLMCAVVWGLVWRRGWGLLPAVPVLMAALVFQAIYRPADILVSGDQESWAYYDRDHRKLHIPEGLGSFQKSVWMGRFGIAPEDEKDQVNVCDKGICYFDLRAGGRHQTILFTSRLTNPFYACRNADIVVVLKEDVPRDACRQSGTDLIIDDDTLWWQGGVALTQRSNDDATYRYDTVKRSSGNWPWIVIGGRVVQ